METTISAARSHSRALALVLLALFYSGSAFAQVDQVMPRIGGFGGSQFTARCAQGDYLNGFELRTGNDVDGLRAICATLSTPGVVWRRSLHPSSFGGPGAGTTRIECPDNAPVVIAIFVLYEGADNVVVNNVHLYCGSATAVNQRTAYPSAIFDGPVDRESKNTTWGDATQDCPPGLVGVGINGKSGTWLDSLGLICGAPMPPSKTLGRIKQSNPKPKVVVVPAPVGAASERPTSMASVSTSPPPPASAPTWGQPAILYGIRGDGGLQWYRHNGAATGAGTAVRDAWAEPKNVNRDWGAFKQAFAGGAGVIYGITQDGRLIWNRHAAFLTGQGLESAGAWETSRVVSTGWGNYRKVFSGGGGIIYAITQSGQLLWFKHTGFASGAPQIEGPRPVANGWGNYAQVFAAGNGIIYALGADGILKWTRHDGYQNGVDAWQGPRDVGRDWNGLRQVFSTGNGIVYSISQDGILRWYKHVAYLEGRGLETPGSWQGGVEVGRGWNSFTNVFAQF
jgi:hypothetical protein